MENKCTLTNEELIAKCKAWVKSLCETGARSWSLSVPVNLDKDPDILFMELADRLAATPPPQGLASESSTPQTDAPLTKGEFQICPKCSGSGMAMNMRNEIPTIYDTCDVCEGEKIIERPFDYSKKVEELMRFFAGVTNKVNCDEISSIITKSERLVRIEYIKKMMYWSAKMAKEVLDSGKTSADINDNIELKYNEIITQKERE